jgi:hypothetical protein
VPRAKAEALEFGTTAHAWLEAYWRDGYSAASRVVDAIEEPCSRAAHDALLAGYYSAWCEPSDVLAVEWPFEVTVDGHVIRGRVDAVVEIDGETWLVEHKTTSSKTDLSPGSPYWQRLRLDQQLGIYMFASEPEFSPVGVIYDVIKKPSDPEKATPPHARKYRKSDGGLYQGQRENDETAEEYEARLRDSLDPKWFARERVAVLERDIAERLRDLVTAGHEIVQLGTRARNPDACLNYNRPCEYWGVCTGEQDLRDELVFMDKESHV